jgi:Hydrogenase maturation factor
MQLIGNAMKGETAHPQQRRWRVSVHGIVQGVGFRPFVFGLAERWQLTGFVRNDSNGVTIEIEGEEQALQAFVHALRTEAPPLARIEQLRVEPLALVGDKEFVITASQAQPQRRTLIAPDTATCADCLREITDPHDRRYRYAFTNCTNCGPRFTIVLDVPYDRINTTMRDFPLCQQCQAEYNDPRDRRFHAQPTACPACGPRLKWSAGDTDDPIAAAAEAIAHGQIVAIKGLGGYHLAALPTMKRR